MLKRKFSHMILKFWWLANMPSMVDDGRLQAARFNLHDWHVSDCAANSLSSDCSAMLLLHYLGLIVMNIIHQAYQD